MPPPLPRSQAQGTKRSGSSYAARAATTAREQKETQSLQLSRCPLLESGRMGVVSCDQALPQLCKHHVGTLGFRGSGSDFKRVNKINNSPKVRFPLPDDDVMQTQLCDWLLSNTKEEQRRAKLTCLHSVSPPGGATIYSSFLYYDVKETKPAYLFIWPLSERLIATGGIAAGWSAEPTGRSNVLGGLIWTQQVAVMGSGMSAREGEVGVYAAHKH